MLQQNKTLGFGWSALPTYMLVQQQLAEAVVELRVYHASGKSPTSHTVPDLVPYLKRSCTLSQLRSHSITLVLTLYHTHARTVSYSHLHCIILTLELYHTRTRTVSHSHLHSIFSVTLALALYLLSRSFSCLLCDSCFWLIATYLRVDCECGLGEADCDPEALAWIALIKLQLERLNKRAASLDSSVLTQGAY